MKRILKQITKSLMVLTIAFSTVLGTGLATGGVAFATTGSAACTNGAETGVINVGTAKNCTKDINDRIYGLAKVIAGIVLGFAVLMIVYAGFKYTTSQGDPKVTEQAKMQIVAAAIGIGIAMLAFVIVGIFEKIM